MKTADVSGDYYVLIGDKEEGPFGLNQLRVMMHNGELQPDTKISCEGWKDWQPLQSVLTVNEPKPMRPAGWQAQGEKLYILEPALGNEIAYVAGWLLLVAGGIALFYGVDFQRGCGEQRIGDGLGRKPGIVVATGIDRD
jgi:hypothetical protein